MDSNLEKIHDNNIIDGVTVVYDILDDIAYCDNVVGLSDRLLAGMETYSKQHTILKTLHNSTVTANTLINYAFEDICTSWDICGDFPPDDDIGGSIHVSLESAESILRKVRQGIAATVEKIVMKVRQFMTKLLNNTRKVKSALEEAKKRLLKLDDKEIRRISTDSNIFPNSDFLARIYTDAGKTTMTNAIAMVKHGIVILDTILNNKKAKDLSVINRGNDVDIPHGKTVDMTEEDGKYKYKVTNRETSGSTTVKITTTDINKMLVECEKAVDVVITMHKKYGIINKAQNYLSKNIHDGAEDSDSDQMKVLRQRAGNFNRAAVFYGIKLPGYMLKTCMDVAALVSKYTHAGEKVEETDKDDDNG